MTGARRASPGPDAHVFCGSARSARPARVVQLLHEHWGRVLLLVPSNRLATQRLEELLLSSDLPGAWDSPVQTLQSFAADLLRERGLNVTLLDEFERRAILEQALDTLRANGDLDVVGSAAGTPGFVNHMLRVITQLKQAAVEPAEFRIRIMASGRHHWLDPIVASAYEGYQTALIACGRYDLVGLYWKAELLCRENCPPVLDRMRHLVLDGFDDFTSSEFRLLEAIAPRIQSMTFSMSCSLADASQRDLYATPRATVTRIQQALKPRIEEFPEAAPERLSQYLCKNLFWRDFPAPVAEAGADVELAVYANPVQEIEAVARRIKALVIEDRVPPRAIAVIYRDLSEHVDTLQWVFAEAGVPVYVEIHPPLSQSGIGRFLLALLEVAPMWRRDAVLDVLASPWFAPGQPGIRDRRNAFAMLARVAQIVEGHDDWNAKMQSLPGLLESAADAAALRARHGDLADAVRAMQLAWTLLTAAVTPIAVAATDVEFLRAVRIALESLQSFAAAAQIADHKRRTREESAWDVLQHLLDALDSWAPNSTHTSSSGDAAARFRYAMASTSYPVEQPRDGVQVLAAESARHLAFEHVFLCGLVEGVVPKPPAASAIYTDKDIDALDAAGIALESRQGRNARERLLFHHGLSLATTRTYLSWHARNRQDKEVGASPFIADVRELAQELVPLHDLRVAAAPSFDNVSSERELLMAAAAHDMVAAAFADSIVPVLAAAARERRRYGNEPFDAYDGRVSLANLVADLRERFGESHQFSARQLEAYARCPFRFFAQEVFKIKPVELPLPELDSMLRGLIMHAALQQFHERFRGKPMAEIDPGEGADAMRDAVRAAWDRIAARDRATPSGVRAAETARLTEQLLRYFEIERARDADWRPEHFEVSFGRTVRERSDAWSRDEPFLLDTPQGPVWLSGVIDRIDASDAGVRILDYKNSIAAHTKSALDDGIDLQLLLYAEVVENYLAQGRACLHAQYVHVGRKAVRECIADAGAERRESMREKVGGYVQGIREGRFSPTPYEDSCTYCEMRRVCRYDAGRIARKEPQP